MRVSQTEGHNASRLTGSSAEPEIEPPLWGSFAIKYIFLFSQFSTISAGGHIGIDLSFTSGETDRGFEYSAVVRRSHSGVVTFLGSLRNYL